METTTEQPIIADTSALVSLATDTDHNHKPATEAAVKLRDAQRPIILPSDVFVETINILGKRSGHETALKAVQTSPPRQPIHSHRDNLPHRIRDREVQKPIRGCKSY